MTEQVLEIRYQYAKPEIWGVEWSNWQRVYFDDDSIARDFPQVLGLELRYRPEFEPGYFQAIVTHAHPEVKWFSSPPVYSNLWERVTVTKLDSDNE